MTMARKGDPLFECWFIGKAMDGWWTEWIRMSLFTVALYNTYCWYGDQYRKRAPVLWFSVEVTDA